MKLLKQNKWHLLASSIVILLPMLLAFFGGSILPEELTIHWGIDGTADGFASPTVAFIVLPLVLLGVHWLCVLATVLVDKDREQNQKIMRMVLWIIPAISLMSTGTIFAVSLGYTTNIFAMIMLLLGVMFIVIGNYMPKIKRSRTAGIKIKWTLANEENWYATHRFSGKLYVILGFVCILCMPLPSKFFPFLCLPIILLCVLLPIIYSYRFYKKQIAEGKVTKEDYREAYRKDFKNNKIALIISAILLPLVAILCAVMLFTGDVEATAGEDALTVKAAYSSDLVIRYEDIDAAEYREGRVDGERVYGVGSPRLLTGTFRNEEFGNYTRYTYTNDTAHLILTVDGKTVVISTGDAAKTQEIYQTILAKIGKE